MVKRSWIHCMVLVCASGAAAIACGNDDDAKVDDTVKPGPTSGSPGASSSSGVPGSSSSSSGNVVEPDAGPLPPTADLVVGHGYNEIGPIKICFAQSTAAPPDEATPLPAVTPLPRGGAGILPPGAIGVLPKLGVNLSEVHLLIYAIRASALAGKGDPTCDQIAGGTQTLNLVKGVDYFALPPLPKGGFADGKTYILLVHRPVGEENGGPVGELSFYTQELDTSTAIDADKVGVQYIHASRYVAGGSAPFIYRPAGAEDPDAGDAGGDPRKEFFAGLQLVPQVAPPTPIVQVAPLSPRSATGFGLRIPTSPTTTADILHEAGGNLLSLDNWVALSDSTGVQVEMGDDGGTSSLYFEPGRSFTFIAWGDPSLGPNPLPPENPMYGLEALKRPHLTVIPNRPKVPALQ